MPRPELSLVIPVSNEEADLPAVDTRLKEVLARLAVEAEVVFVDDGSRDRTMDTLLGLAGRDARYRVLGLSRSFGRESAIAAGLDRARGRAVIVTDTELQPPEVFLEALERWKAGFDVVIGRRKRSGEPLGAGVIASLFGALMPVDVPLDAGDFRLLSRRVVATLRALRETHASARGLIAWAGFRQTTVEFERLAPEKTIGTGELLARALEGVGAFSTRPLRLATWAGALLGVCTIVFAIVGLAVGLGVAAAVVPLLFSVQFLLIGILGEYVGRIYEQVKRRPRYVVAQRIGFGSKKRATKLVTRDLEEVPSFPRTPSVPPALPKPTSKPPPVAPVTTRAGSSEVPPPPAAVVAAGAAAERAISQPRQRVASVPPMPSAPPLPSVPPVPAAPERPSVTPAPPTTSASAKPPPLKLTSSLGSIPAAPPAPVVPERASTPPVAPRRPSFASIPHPAVTTPSAPPVALGQSRPPSLPRTPSAPPVSTRSAPPAPPAPPAPTPRVPSVSRMPAVPRPEIAPATARSPSTAPAPAAAAVADEKKG